MAGLGVGLEKDPDKVYHASFAASRTDDNCVYDKATHQKYNAVLNGYCDGIGILAKPPCLVYGPRGCGKSTLLANWIRTRRERDSVSVREHVYAHFVTATRDSLQLTNMLSRLFEKVKEAYDMSEDVPTQYEKVKWGLARFLQTAVRKAPTVALIIVIDAVDEIRSPDGEHEPLRWLPLSLPPQIRIIVSGTTSIRSESLASVHRGSFMGILPRKVGAAGGAGAGSEMLTGRTGRTGLSLRKAPPTFDNTRAIAEFQRRECVRAEMGHLDVTAAGNIIESFTTKFGISLSDQQLEMLKYHPPAREPLYLRIVLESLRSLLITAKLDSWTHAARAKAQQRRMERLLRSESTLKVAEVAFDERQTDVEGPQPTGHEAALEGSAELSEDDGGGAAVAPLASEYTDPRFFQYTMALLYVSRLGLSVYELTFLLGAWRIKFPARREAVVRQLLRDFCWCTSDEQYLFSHEEYRRVVWDRCIGSPEQRVILHGVVARYFLQQVPSRRVAMELPWHLERSGQWTRLKDCLVTVPLISFWNTFSLRRNWQHCWRLLSTKTAPLAAGAAGGAVGQNSSTAGRGGGVGGRAGGAGGPRSVAGSTVSRSRRTVGGASSKKRGAGRGGGRGRARGYGAASTVTGRNRRGSIADKLIAHKAMTVGAQTARSGVSGLSRTTGAALRREEGLDADTRPCYDVVDEYVAAVDNWVATSAVPPSADELVAVLTQIGSLLLEYGEAEAELARETQDEEEMLKIDIPDVLRPEPSLRALSGMGLTTTVEVLMNHAKPSMDEAHLALTSPSGAHQSKKKRKKKAMELQRTFEIKDCAWRASYYFRRWVWMQWPWMALAYKAPHDASRRRTTAAMVSLGNFNPIDGPEDPAAAAAGGPGGEGGGEEAGGASPKSRLRKSKGHKSTNKLINMLMAGAEGEGEAVPAGFSMDRGPSHKSHLTALAEGEEVDSARDSPDAAAATASPSPSAAESPSKSPGKLSKHGMLSATTEARFEDSSLDVPTEFGPGAPTRLDLGKQGRFDRKIEDLRVSNVNKRNELDRLKRLTTELEAKLAVVEDECKELMENADFTREKNLFNDLNGKIIRCEAQQIEEENHGVALRRIMAQVEKHRHHCDATHAGRLEKKANEQLEQMATLKRERARAVFEARDVENTLMEMRATFRQNSLLHRNVIKRLEKEREEVQRGTDSGADAKSDAGDKKKAAADDSRAILAGQAVFRKWGRSNRKLTVEEWESRLAVVRERTGIADPQHFYDVWKKHHERGKQLVAQVELQKEQLAAARAEDEAVRKELENLKFGQATPGILSTELRAKEDEIHEATNKLRADQNNYTFASHLVQQSTNGIRHLADLVGILHPQQQAPLKLLAELESVVGELLNLLRHMSHSAHGSRAESASGPEAESSPHHPPPLNLSGVGAGHPMARRSSFARMVQVVPAGSHENLHAMLSRSLLSQHPTSKIYVTPVKPPTRPGRLGLADAAAAGLDDEDDEDDVDAADGGDDKPRGPPAGRQPPNIGVGVGAGGMGGARRSFAGRSRSGSTRSQVDKRLAAAGGASPLSGTSGSPRGSPLRGPGGTGPQVGGAARRGFHVASSPLGRDRAATGAAEVDNESIDGDGAGSGSGGSDSGSEVSEESDNEKDRVGMFAGDVSDDDEAWAGFDRAKYKKSVNHKAHLLEHATLSPLPDGAPTPKRTGKSKEKAFSAKKRAAGAGLPGL